MNDSVTPEQCTACLEPRDSNDEPCDNCGALPGESDVDRIIRHLEEENTELTGQLEALREQAAAPAVEVLVEVDDGEVSVCTWVNGDRREAVVETVEPNDGLWSEGEWTSDTCDVAGAGRSPGFTAAVVEARNKHGERVPWCAECGTATGPFRIERDTETCEPCAQALATS